MTRLERSDDGLSLSPQTLSGGRVVRRTEAPREDRTQRLGRLKGRAHRTAKDR